MTFPSEAAVAFEVEDEDEDEFMDVGFGVVLPIAGPGALDGGGECDKKLPPPSSRCACESRCYWSSI